MALIFEKGIVKVFLVIHFLFPVVILRAHVGLRCH